VAFQGIVSKGVTYYGFSFETRYSRVPVRCIVGLRSDAAYGPSPVMNYESVKQSSYNYAKTRDAFVVRAGYSLGRSPQWYEATRAGFDYVDEQCDAYLAALYRLRRDRDSTKSQIQSFGITTTAILGFTEALPKTILITAAAFGLAAQATDNASSALLFAMDPSDIQTLVKSPTDAYRAGADTQQMNYTTSNAAIEGIRGYLKLCLSVSIEAQVKAALQGTLHVSRTTTFGVPALNRVQTASPNAVGVALTSNDLLTQRVYVPKLSNAGWNMRPSEVRFGNS